MKIALIPDGPLDAPATLARYHLWGEDPANRVDGDVFRRVLRLGDRLLPYEVRWQGPVDATRLEVRVPDSRSSAVARAVEREVRSIFGLGFDLPGFYRMAKADPGLAPLLERLYGLRPTLAPSTLEMLIGAITAQQVNLVFAFSLRARLVRRYGAPRIIEAVTVYAFPTAETLARARVRDLRAMQYSVRKAEYIRGVAQALTSGALDAQALALASDAHVIEQLTALRGLGRWTADWYLARCLGRGAVCPAGDLAVRKAFHSFYGRGRTLSEKAIRRRAATWGPYQNLAVHYLLAGMRLATTRIGGGT
jgi:DNA-3-methyladenine glycosylase II